MYVRNEATIKTAAPIAIVGAALQFPGASDPASFHELTTAGRRMFRELAWTAADRSQANGHGPAASLDGPLRAALLDGEETIRNRDDCADSGVAGRRTLAAETAAAALADVPLDGHPLGAGRTGVIIADTPEPDTPEPGTPEPGTPEPGTRNVSDWVRDQLGLGRTAADENGAAGSNGSAGPDEAGSGVLYCSLRAVAAACEALTAGKFDLVLAGGVSRGIDYGWLTRRAQAGSLATGDMRVYDASPTGTLPGEGCGVVALVRAAGARAAGLPAYAEIAGWHAAEPGAGQQATLRAAYLRAGIDPGDIQFVEGHGAATAAEDLAELSALLELLGPRADGVRKRCALGAVSANIGDTRGAAGVAALLKTALAMAADTIPPTTGCTEPHELLRGEEAPFRLPRAPEPWPETAVKLAAVNSLGAAGHQGAPASGPVHIVLRREREPGGRAGRRRRAASASSGAAAGGSHRGADATAPSDATAPPRTAGAHVAPPRPRTPQDSHPPDQPARSPAATGRSSGGLLRRLAGRFRRNQAEALARA